ncbi:uncharacterized protein LOC126772307 [Nymphalis io]|uniref:uncharacterized protein LOC126772307 n=1 Tax=Inachis io TaxID=171585 RepID=UPI0021674187|nr:uncharacterized protein LOC126772307 [Nymphalis io]XP_050348562.1 uncharacterized protein LOC126772307 [Nymphalis io]
MHFILCVLITATCAFADNNQNRRTKLPYIADAVGNSLPPPSSVPATVGSPVNLLTPDRYEFYTFDESGELVKRLMTLEEIQAIVAAGEETDGLVTFANDNQPTVAFNFSQPSHTKVHSVVTNVQNVLKSQMEAHKKKPNVQPTFDTPDVSDSWSLILPSIFGNTGVDIVPDKTSGSFITPETETIDIDNLNMEYENSQSKESNEIPTMPTFEVKDKNNDVTAKPLTEVSLFKRTTTESSHFTTTTTTTSKPFTTISKVTTTTTKQPVTKTTNKPLIITTTNRSKLSSSTSTVRPPPTTTINAIISTTSKFLPSHSTQQYSNITNINENNTSIRNFTAKPIQYEKISTFSPISTPAYIAETITEMSNNKQAMFSHENVTNIKSNTILFSPLKNNENEYEKNISIEENTSQSVSPLTIASTTEMISSQNNQIENNVNVSSQTQVDESEDKESQTSLPLFDVAQSISQIASDLGNNYVPIPTSNSLLDTTKINNIDIESKENVEIEIPIENGNENEIIANHTNESDNFIKISTIDPHIKIENTKEKEEVQTTSLPPSTTTMLSTTNTNTMDVILTGSVDDLISQVANEGPAITSIVYHENNTEPDESIKEMEEKLYSTYDSLSVETTTSNLVIDTTINSSHTNTSSLKKNNDDKTNVLKEFKDEIIDIENDISKSTINKNISVTKYGLDSSNHNSSSIRNSSNILNNYNILKNLTKSEEKKKVDMNSESIKAVDKVESSTFVNVSTENNIVTTVLPDITTTQQINKVNNKFQKLEAQIPKFDEFKKKIQKVNIDEKELANERNNSWKLISTVTPPKVYNLNKDKHKVEGFYIPESNDKGIVLEFPKENQGLEVTTKDLGEDVLQFTELCNELAFRYWNVLTENTDKKRSIVFSPYSITSMLAMMFMGAKGATSGEMNEVLKLDDMVTFNPHFTLKNISDSIDTTSASGVSVSAFIRELYSERSKGKILTFYKERAQHFYNGHVEEINFNLISDIIRRRTNLLIKRYTWGKIAEYIKSNSITMHPPLAAFSANIFHTDCSGSSVEGRDGEMYFVVSPNVRQRRLVPVPAVVFKSNFLAGYDPVLDATAAALGNTNSVVSTLFLMPGQQGNVVHAEDLENLEKRFIDSDLSTSAWNRLLRTLLPRNGLELQIPRLSHKSIFNVSSTLRKMGLKELFDANHADLGGMNGPSKDLYLSDMIQLTSFVTCGEAAIGEQHHIEEYPETLDLSHKHRTSRWLTGWDEPRDYQRAFHDPHDVGDAMHLPLHLRPRQARLPARNTQPARLKFDRPFLFFVRHNPSGMILYVGRYNPRLLP